MIVTLILILLIIVFMAFFIGMNLSNVCTFWFFKTYTDLPVAVLTLIAFGAGIIFALLFILVAKMKAPASDAEIRAQKKLEKKQRAEEKQAGENSKEAVEKNKSDDDWPLRNTDEVVADKPATVADVGRKILGTVRILPDGAGGKRPSLLDKLKIEKEKLSREKAAGGAVNEKGVAI